MNYSSQDDSTANGLIYDAVEEAKSQIELGHPCFKHNSTVIKVPVNVSSYGRSTELEAAEANLKSKQFYYFRELDGYLVGYENLRLAANHGYIDGDSPLIQWPIGGDFYSFHPVVDSLITGKIQSFLGNCDDKVTVLVANGIRALVSFPNPIPKKLSPFIHLSAKVWFKIDKLDHKFCQMAGTITEEAIEKMIKGRKKGC